jgi:lactobin A/cerein 7B family class IIb bacteriocin
MSVDSAVMVTKELSEDELQGINGGCGPCAAGLAAGLALFWAQQHQAAAARAADAAARAAKRAHEAGTGSI